MPHLVITTLLLAALGHAGTPQRRWNPPKGQGAVCQEPDGRIRLGCLPSGTLRGAPPKVAKPFPQKTPAPKPSGRSRKKT